MSVAKWAKSGGAVGAVISIYLFSVGPSTGFGAPPTQAPWVYVNENMYQTELPRVEDLQTPESREEQSEVVSGALQTVGNTAQTVRPPPAPGTIVDAAAAVAVGIADAVGAALRALHAALF